MRTMGTAARRNILAASWDAALENDLFGLSFLREHCGGRANRRVRDRSGQTAGARGLTRGHLKNGRDRKRLKRA
jgi:hypothetical protein